MTDPAGASLQRQLDLPGKADHFLSADPFDYFSVPALNASLAKQLIKSAAHGREYMLNPLRPTASMQLGTAVHAAILEPHKTPFVVRPADLDRRTKDGKAAYAALEAGGLPILTQDEADAVQRIRDNVLAIADVASALSHGKTEVPAFWDGRNVSCKAKADLVAGDAVFDIKTCQDASQRGFLSSVYKYGYALQARHYLDGFDASEFIFIAVETSAPYAVAVYDLSDDLLSKGDKFLDIAAARYRHGMNTGEWPGFDSHVVTLGSSFSDFD